MQARFSRKPKKTKLLEDSRFVRAAVDSSQKERRKGTFDDDGIAHDYINDLGDIRREIQHIDLDGKWVRYDYLTDDERTIYNGLYATEGIEAAKEYLGLLERDLNKRKMDAIKEDSKALAKESPVLGVLQNLAGSFGTPFAYADTWLQKIKGDFSEDYIPADTNRPLMSGVHVVSSTTEGLTENLNPTWKFLAETGLSVGQFLSKLPLGQGMALAVMGSGAAGSMAVDVMEKGGTADQALTTGTIAGVAEVVFEKMGIDRLIKFANVRGVGQLTAKGISQQILKGAAEEGLEEFGTEVVNILADSIINGDISNAELMRQGFLDMGLSEEEANKKMYEELAKQVALSFAGGALSGGVMGGGATAMGQFGVLQQGKNADADSVISRGLDMPEGTYARDYANELSNIEKPSNYKIGKLDIANNYALSENISSLVADQIKEDGEVKQFQRIFDDVIYGEELSNRDIKKIESNEKAKSIYNDLLAAKEEMNAYNSLMQANYEGEEEPQETREIKQPIKLVNIPATEISTGESVTVTGIIGVNDNAIDVRLSNGKTVDVMSVNFADKALQQAYVDAADYDTQGAQAYVDSYEQSNEPYETFKQGFKDLHKGAEMGMPMGDIVSRSFTASQMPLKAQGLAYDAGFELFKGRTKATNAETATAQKMATEAKPVETKKDSLTTSEAEQEAYKKGGVIRKDTIDADTVTTAQIDVLDALGKKYKVAFVIKDQVSGGTANGLKVLGTNQIEIARDAIGNGILYTAFHEMGHNIQEFAPKEWAKLSTFVIKELAKTPGFDLNARISEYMKAYEGVEGFTRNDATFEMVCEALPTILTSETVVEQIITENPGLAKRIMDWMKDFISDLKGIMQDITGRGRKEIAALQGNIETVQKIYDLFDEGMMAAKETIEIKATEYNKNDTQKVKQSLKDISDIDNDTKQLINENAEMQKAESILREQFELTKGRKANRKGITVIANRLLKQYNSNYDSATFAENFNKLIDFIEGNENVSYSEIMGVAAEMSKPVIESSSKLNTTLYDQYADMRDYLRNTAIQVSERAKTEIASTYDSWNNFRRKNFGRINFQNDGLHLEMAYAELSGKYPEMFDPNITDLDMAQALADAVDAIKPYYENPYGMNIDEAAYSLAQEMFSEYFNMPEYKSLGTKLTSLNAQHRKSIEQLKKLSSEDYRRKLDEVQSLHTKSLDVQERKTQLALDKAKVMNRNKTVELRQKTKERESVKKYRKSITKTVNELYKWTAKPTKEQKSAGGIKGRHCRVFTND